MTTTERQNLIAKAKEITAYVEAHPDEPGNVGRIFAAQEIVNLAMGGPTEVTEIIAIKRQIIEESG